ncbi:helix-turn-helix domain-containing protein [Avibacterium sp. 21-599]|uniref:helix-turn-helix domain-containing protein n=1 Tax=Avibacterium sp. 21-599 TaxID=2911528 RepID=UPI003FA34442
MNTYKHLTLYECEKIMVFHALGKTITQIAQQLYRHKSTISRELRHCYRKLGGICCIISTTTLLPHQP